MGDTSVSDRVSGPAKMKVDKDLKRITRVQEATRETGRRVTGVGLSVLFLVVVWVYATTEAGIGPGASFVVLAGVIGGYMALNIGANDVANNVGPAVGSRALTMAGALAIAAIFEAAGAILAGGDVVNTISKGIIDPGQVPSSMSFVLAMTSALLAAALWLHLATYLRAPVSTTHSIVGGVLGAGLAAAGTAAVDWLTVATIAASWVISPVLGGVIAAGFLAFVKSAVIYKTDKIAAARRWVPVLVAIMAGAFTMYMMVKGLKRVWRFDTTEIWVAGVIGAFVVYLIVRPLVRRASVGLENRRKAVSSLFTAPLIFAAAMLSFAHGANDVANAVGPLAAVVSTVGTGTIESKVAVPIWVMVVGGVGIAAGLALFGPRIIKRVGEQITKLDRARAFCVALSAAITVLAASWLGLPVSSTHIAVGAIFGVGFLREFRANRAKNRNHASSKPAGALAQPSAASNPGNVLADPMEAVRDLERKERKLRKAAKRRLVRRQHMLTIIAAWLVTVPIAAGLAAGIFLVASVAVSD